MMLLCYSVEEPGDAPWSKRKITFWDGKSWKWGGVESENKFIYFQTKEGRKASHKTPQVTKLIQEMHGKVRNRRQHPQDASVSPYVSPWFEQSLLHVKNGTYQKNPMLAARFLDLLYGGIPSMGSDPAFPAAFHPQCQGNCTYCPGSHRSRCQTNPKTKSF